MEIEADFARRLGSSIEIRLDLLQTEQPGDSFEALRALPDLYRLLWRLAFEMHLPPAARHYAASLAFYVFSRLDYLAEESSGTLVYLDDLAVAARGVANLRTEIGEASVAEHWKDEQPLDRVLAAAERLLARHLPQRVEDKVSAYLAR